MAELDFCLEEERKILDESEFGQYSYLQKVHILIEHLKGKKPGPPILDDSIINQCKRRQLNGLT